MRTSFMPAPGAYFNTIQDNLQDTGVAFGMWFHFMLLFGHEKEEEG